MIKYRRAQEIINQVADDLSSYYDQGLIDFSKLYKVIRKCNAALGEKINPEKQEVIHVKNFKSYLPEDFSALNYAFVCKTKTILAPPPPKGFQIEYKTICEGTKSCSPCITECDNQVVIYQKLDENWTQFKDLEVVRISPKSFNKCNHDCPNVFSKSGNIFTIEEDSSITTTFETGEIYMNYVGVMENSDEDLLIIDHPLVEPYYEAELIKQILKLIVYNKDADVAQLYQDSLRELGRARKQAMDFVNTPGYDEIRNLFQSQRVRLHNKYFAPIMDDHRRY